MRYADQLGYMQAKLQAYIAIAHNARASRNESHLEHTLLEIHDLRGKIRAKKQAAAQPALPPMCGRLA